MTRGEVKTDEGSRFDFRLSDHPGSPAPCWIEVKSVTLCADRHARFPDAVTERGRRHLEHLMARKAAGDRAALLFVVQRADADDVAPADDIDPPTARRFARPPKRAWSSTRSPPGSRQTGSAWSVSCPYVCRRRPSLRIARGYSFPA